jgi:DNA-binding NarL/FixJ family response regulator
VSESPIKIVITCGDAPYTRALASWLDSHPELRVVAAEHANISVVKLIEENQADILVIARYEAARSLVSAAAPITGVVLFDEDGWCDAASMIKLGARAVVPRGTTLVDLRNIVVLAAGGSFVVAGAEVRDHFDGLARRAPRSEAALTAREHEVLRLLTAGSSTTDIARRLDVSTVTVRSHIQRILRKLDARSRGHAVSIAYRLGLV